MQFAKCFEENIRQERIELLFFCLKKGILNELPILQNLLHSFIDQYVLIKDLLMAFFDAMNRAKLSILSTTVVGKTWISKPCMARLCIAISNNKTAYEKKIIGIYHRPTSERASYLYTDFE